MRTFLRRAAWAVLALSLCLYVCACVLLYVKQRDLLFYPTPPVGRPPDVFGPSGMITAIDVPSADPQVRLAGWMVNGDRKKALLFFGGNAERVEDNAVFFRDCLPNHTVYLIGYRGYGDSDGEPSEQALFADALALEAQLRTEGYSQIDVMGRSLGSGVAVYLASQRDIGRVMLVTPYDSIAAVGQGHYPWFPVRWLSKDRFDSLAYAPKVRAQVKLIIAGKDRIIPPAHAHSLLKGFSPTPIVHEIDDADHANIAVHHDYVREVCGFLNPP